MGELVTYPSVSCSVCQVRHHPDAVGPDRRCVRCWERDLAPSETGPVLQTLIARAGRALATVGTAERLRVQLDDGAESRRGRYTVRDQLDPTRLRRTLQRRGQVATSTAITSVVVTVAAVFAGCPTVVGVGVVVLVVAALVAIRADNAIERLPR